MNRISISLLAAGFSLAGAAQAFAHASFEIDKAVSERGFKAILQIPHGCDGKPTTDVQIKLPEGVSYAGQDDATLVSIVPPVGEEAAPAAEAAAEPADAAKK